MTCCEVSVPRQPTVARGELHDGLDADQPLLMVLAPREQGLAVFEQAFHAFSQQHHFLAVAQDLSQHAHRRITRARAPPRVASPAAAPLPAASATNSSIKPSTAC